MDILTPLTDEPTGAAEARRLTLLTLSAGDFGWRADLLEGVSDVKAVLDIESSWKARDSILRQWSGSTTFGAGAVDGLSLRLQAPLTECVETSKQLRLVIRLLAFGAFQLSLQLLQCFLTG